jgi:probable O-glycosylation ligase (exosortase A-associated)
MRSLALFSLFLAYLPPVFLQPFCGILLWTWFSIMNPHRLVWGFGSAIPYALIIAMATLTAWFVSREPKVPPRDAVFFGLIGLMVAISISTLFALAPDAAANKWSLVFKTQIMAVLTLAMLTSKVRIHAFAWVMALSLGYYGVKGGAFAIVTGGAYRVYGPEGSYISDNNHLALALVMAIPLMHFLHLQSRVRWVRFGLIAMMVLSMIAVIGSYSRGSFLALVGMTALIWWRSRTKFGLTIILGGFALLVFFAAPQEWFDRIHTISAYQEDDSAQGRLTIWRAGLEIVAHHPVFGGGFLATQSQAILHQYAPGTATRAVHNSHLEVLIENGVVGFVFHLILIVATWIYGQKIRRMTNQRPDMVWSRDLAAMLQTSLAGYVMGGSFLSLGYYDGWYNIAIAMAALYTLVSRQIKQESVEQNLRISSQPYPATAAAMTSSRRYG